MDTVIEGCESLDNWFDNLLGTDFYPPDMDERHKAHVQRVHERNTKK
jgi:hypothetical protein